MTKEEAMRLLEDAGYRHSRRRERMVQILADEDRYLTARELWEKMQAAYPELSADTIYRNLGLLHDMGIVTMTEFQGERRYRFHCGIRDHHHHFICLGCGASEEVLDCPLDHLQHRFKDAAIVGHRFEIFGYCPACQQKARDGEGYGTALV
ncbi:MAG: Fur family transcriptional regulator [Bacillota bacterium]|nr:Fur family transcriptional regulator [Bacillota bacterium]